MAGPITVIFRSMLRSDGRPLKDELNVPVAEAAVAHPGLRSWKTFTSEDGERVTIVVFDDVASLDQWRRVDSHMAAKRRRGEVYEWHSTEVLSPLGPITSWRSSGSDEAG